MDSLSSSSYARQLTLCLLAFWSCAGVVFRVHSSSSHFTMCHVFPLPLSGANWRSLFPLRGSGSPLPKMASPSAGSAHTPLSGSDTILTLQICTVHTLGQTSSNCSKLSQICKMIAATIWGISIRFLDGSHTTLFTGKRTFSFNLEGVLKCLREDCSKNVKVATF